MKATEAIARIAQLNSPGDILYFKDKMTGSRISIAKQYGDYVIWFYNISAVLFVDVIMMGPLPNELILFTRDNESGRLGIKDWEVDE